MINEPRSSGQRSFTYQQNIPFFKEGCWYFGLTLLQISLSYVARFRVFGYWHCDTSHWPRVCCWMVLNLKLVELFVDIHSLVSIESPNKVGEHLCEIVMLDCRLKLPHTNLGALLWTFWRASLFFLVPVLGFQATEAYSKYGWITVW